MGRTAIGITDIGFVRTNNEDTIFVCNEKISRLDNVYIVADGMGGHNAGEIASSEAIRFFCEYINNNVFDSKYKEHFLSDAVRYANYMVYNASLQSPAFNGMGTTFTVCSTDNINLYFAHVGDSRLYIIDEILGLKQISEDHTLVHEMEKDGKISAQEAKRHPNRNIVTRALGTDAEVLVDCGYVPLSGSEYILLCSDGLSDMVDDRDISKIILSEMPFEYKAKSLIELAKNNGGADNVSIILA